MATASLVPAIFQAADAAILQLKQTAVSAKNSPFFGKKPEELAYTQGMVHLGESDFKGGMHFGEILTKANVGAATGSGKSNGTFGGPSKVSRHSFGTKPPLAFEFPES
jgi:xanthine dehydrogenase YagR molybdenum-binding subunit